MTRPRLVPICALAVLIAALVSGCRSDASSEPAPEVQACVQEKISEGMGDSEALTTCVEELNG